MSEKYPRTFHLPFSPGATKDDKRHPDIPGLFVGMPLTLTEKVDGSNVCLEQKQVYARSHQGAPRHPSFDALKAFHASVMPLLPDNMQLFGEWCWARHSIAYGALPHYLLLFGVRDIREQTWLEWEAVERWANILGCATVPLLEQFTAQNDTGFRAVVERHARELSVLGGEREGVVVRWSGRFAQEDFSRATGKWVRAGHIQTDDHWTGQAIVRNRLRAP